MEKRHIIQLQGREFVTYEGLLDAAHKQGLQQIKTRLIQVPGPENDHTAICEAECSFLVNGVTRTFGGIGDASPKNVSRNVAMHVIRMAETRAKARAMRDAINVGMTAMEELEIAELSDPTAKHATRAQIDRVGTEMERVGMDQEAGRAWILAQFGKASRMAMTGGEIGAFLTYLASLPDARKAASA